MGRKANCIVHFLYVVPISQRTVACYQNKKDVRIFEVFEYVVAHSLCMYIQVRTF